MKRLLFTLLMLVHTHALFAGNDTTRPNIIIIYADDLGYGDLSSYGSEIPTPNIDRIGKSGIRFTDFYAAAPVCSPSRYSLLTGGYPQRSKHHLNTALMPNDESYLDTTEITLANYLRAKHYQTALIGKWHLGEKGGAKMPTAHGFDVFTGFRGGCIDYFTHSYGGLEQDWYVNNQPVKEKGYATDLITQYALSYIGKQKNRHPQQPFFLMIGYNAPHYGKTAPDSITGYTLSLGKNTYGEQEMLNTLQVPAQYLQQFSFIKDAYRRAYAAMVSNLDDNVGLLLQKLAKEKLLQNTIIWFMSDNGGYAVSHHGHASNGRLRGEKGALLEGGIRVPALVMWPQRIKKGQVIHTPVSNLDVLPTIGALTRFTPVLPTDGKDIRNILFQQPVEERDLYWQYGQQTAVRRGNWKLVNNHELYNLSTDPGESDNVAVQYPEKVKELQAAYEKEMERVAQ
ncbi:sulfatase-like hydrolase/transferase [Chitinophaga nivalis]|uniref:Sulfatase-like hydrolase/transferase n=1 Tax=Chitinophaga nivalis TaxID=2991709 RepID=A0ABT3IG83_9BACT|nr:sulfatase-like hydrolase/transferase [Chitinophaga nivalis]MCW3467340.1 sulfatase-like hydrolase/transferase [Chitinophaga nivalis]MCW3482968.1 sulfatase-like hydrolase/transferase [Chitinophaga nivalis]